MESKISIIRAFEDITDPRIDRTKLHKLIDIIFITICGVLCRCEGWEDIECFANERIDWLRKFVELENGIPSHDTIRRVFERISPQEFQKCLISWSNEICKLTPGNIVAIDGKTIRRSFNTASKNDAIHLLSAWASKTNLVLGQQKVDGKTNEITQILEFPRFCGRFSALGLMKRARTLFHKPRATCSREQNVADACCTSLQ